MPPEWQKHIEINAAYYPREERVSSATASVPLLALHIFASSIWVGGLVTIFVASRAAAQTLDAPQRIAFFRALGRSYGVVGGIALLVAMASGAALLHGHPWDGLLIATAIVAAALLIATAAGVAQARAMTRLRQRALAQAEGGALEARVRRGAILATGLRAAIGVLTLALVVLGAALARQ